MSRVAFLAALFGVSALVAGVVAVAQENASGTQVRAEEFVERAEEALEAFDYPAACKWYALANVFGGSEYRELYDGVTLILTDQEIADCIKEARAWRPEAGEDDEDDQSGDDDFADDYYASAQGKSGDELRRALHLIIRKHKRLSYREVWSALEYTDEDPDNTSNVILFYTGRSQAKSKKDQGGRDPDLWNREHVWPKSHGFKSKGLAAHNDIHQLRPTDKSVNSDRGSLDFDNGGREHGEAVGARLDRDSFEPPDRVKGDVARVVFYMDVRYEGDSGMPDLRVINRDSPNSAPTLGHLCTLMAWHKTDPVSDWERRRNNRTFEKQENRNPFIDHPEWADALWGSECP